MDGHFHAGEDAGVHAAALVKAQEAIPAVRGDDQSDLIEVGVQHDCRPLPLYGADHGAHRCFVQLIDIGCQGVHRHTGHLVFEPRHAGDRSQVFE